MVATRGCGGPEPVRTFLGAVLLVAAVAALGLAVADPALREAAGPVPALEPTGPAHCDKNSPAVTGGEATL